MSLGTLSENLRRHRTAAVLSILGVMAVGGFISLIVTRDPDGQKTLWLDLARGLVTLVIVGILGTVLKLLADDYQARRLREEQRSEFRMDKYRRLVKTTNKLRRIPLLVPADSSPGSLRQYLLDILDVGAELRVIKHEIWASGGVSDSPFPDPEPVTHRLERMYSYVDALASEFEQALSELHVADGENPAWDKLNEPRSKSGDFLTAAGREEVKDKLESWNEYLGIEIEVLRLLTAAALGQRPVRESACRPDPVQASR